MEINQNLISYSNLKRLYLYPEVRQESLFSFLNTFFLHFMSTLNTILLYMLNIVISNHILRFHNIQVIVIRNVLT
jgi:hypothetical protein